MPLEEGFFGCEWRLDLVAVGNDGRIGVASDDSGIVHEVGSFEFVVVPVAVLGFEGGDFRFGGEVELSGGVFHEFRKAKI